VAVWSEGKKARFGQFANDSNGFEELIEWAGEVEKFAMEATGPYHKALFRCLKERGLVAICYNPLRARKLAEGMGELNKDDKVDALLLARVVANLSPEPTVAPRLALETAQELSRRIQQVVANRSKDKVRLEEPRTSDPVRASLERSIAWHDQEVKLLETELDVVIASDPELKERYRLMLSVPNVGPKTARILVTELPEELYDAKKAVGLAGLAPKRRRSGTSLKAPDHISRCCNQRLKRALYMPAIQSLRWKDRDLALFHARLVAAGKHKQQATVAVMRKILTRVLAVLLRRTPWEMRPTS
jgi:transposase